MLSVVGELPTQAIHWLSQESLNALLNLSIKTVYLD